ncbi:MAG: ABC transporter ATP-binding protein [Rubrivivax sp.]
MAAAWRGGRGAEPVSWLPARAELLEIGDADGLLSLLLPDRDAAAQAPAWTPAQPLLALHEVTLEYATERRMLRATQRVSLQVYEGDRYVLLGPSGCGKSTLLKAAAGFVAPREGRISLAGQPVDGPGPERIVVFQEFDQLPPWKTVLANVAFPLRVAKGWSRASAEERARELLAQVGLADFAGAHPHQLSGGMKQRVAIARALAMRPRVLLMDEPFAALDALTRRRMQEELLALWQRFGFTLLFVTHSIEEALIIGSRVGVLTPRPGRLRAEFDAARFGLADAGGAAFQAAAQELHALLFDEAAA